MDRLRTLRSLTAMLAASVALAACGGSHSTTLPALGGSQNGGKTVATENATFQFTVPKTTTSAVRVAGRAPRYISAATKSIQLALTSAAIGLPVPNNPQVLNVPNGTGSAPGAPCVPSGPNFICTMTVKLPIGSDGLTFTTYDANNGAAGGGNLLSEQKSTVTIVQGVANGPGGAFTITLDANAATMTVSGSGACQNGPIGSSFGSVGTTPVGFSVAYTDPAGKTIVSPGLPKLSVTATGVAGGTIGVAVNQAAQTYTLTPSASGVSGTINVQAVQADSTGSSDGLSFTRTKSYTFATGNPPPGNFLAAVEQFGVGSGAVDLFTVALGGSGGADTISAFTPATLATTNSTNEGKPDVDNPLNLVFDSTGDLLIGNGGTTTGSPVDNGNLACVPVGAIATGQNTSTTVTPNVDDPVGIAYDSRDGSVALANNPVSAPVQLAEYLLTGNYTAASAPRNLTAAGYGSFSVVNLPTLAAGTYAIALTDGVETDPAHNTGKAKIAILSPTGVETDIVDNTTFAIDIPRGLAWDAQNNQLVIANFSAFHKLLSFYTVSPVAQVKTINTNRRNYMVAASANGNVAVAGNLAFGYPQVQVYDNTAARNPVAGPIPFNGTTTSCGSTYIYGSSTTVINSMTWLSNTKLLMAVQSYNGAVSTAQNGLYVFDISATAVPAGFDDVSCSAFAAAPKQTGFVHINNKPLGTAFKP
ncbi:MAG: hypothetical protein QOI11_3158 [Candidatus Eremiobacteraeota bacterium]|nr:hypothetical protein [Candidatus Eremiobacteraeota bacterium]